MTPPSPYDWVAQAAVDHYLQQGRPTLSLVSSHQPTPIGEKSMPKPSQPSAAQRGRVSLSAQKPEVNTANTLAMPPLHKHGAFDDLYAAADLLSLGAEALAGLGAMMQPSVSACDEAIVMARRSDASAVFRFIGAALREPAATCYNAANRLERAAQGERV